MRKALIAAVLASSQLSGCFVFIPGSVVGAAADAITGDKGEHCVPRGTVVGQRINLGFNRVGVVEYVGTSPSSRCNDPMMPIRAALAFPANLPTQEGLPLFGSVQEQTFTLCNYRRPDGTNKALTLGAGEACPAFIAN